VPDCGLGPGSGRGNGLDTTCVTRVEEPTPLADAALDHTTPASANTAANPMANSFNLIPRTTFTSVSVTARSGYAPQDALTSGRSRNLREG